MTGEEIIEITREMKQTKSLNAGSRRGAALQRRDNQPTTVSHSTESFATTRSQITRHALFKEVSFTKKE